MTLTKEQVEEIRKAVQEAIAGIMVKNPFLGMLLKKTWIFVEDCDDTAFTDGLKIVVCYRWFSQIGKQMHGARNQSFTLLHELMHIILKHSIRQKEYVEKYQKFVPPIIMNIVADAKVNQYILDLPMFKYIDINVITPEWLEQVFKIQNVREKSFEEILDEIAKNYEIKVVGVIETDVDIPPPEPIPPVPPNGPVVIVKPKKPMPPDNQSQSQNIPLPMPLDKTFGRGNKNENKEGGERVPVNEGDKEDLEAEKEGKTEERWRKKMAESIVSAKMAGFLPLGWERLINELLKPEIDWRRLLLTVLTKGIGTKVKRTWSRPSRKLPFVHPGKETLKLSKVLVLIDTSGSIGEQELKKFASEVYGILKENAEVIVIPWDATAYDPIVLKSPRDIEKLKTGLRGGGGTCILPALEMVDKKFSNADMIVIFSDWMIADIGNDKVQQLLRKYSNRILAFTTYAEPPSFLRSFKIKIS